MKRTKRHRPIGGFFGSAGSFKKNFLKKIRKHRID